MEQRNWQNKMIKNRKIMRKVNRGSSFVSELGHLHNVKRDGCPPNLGFSFSGFRVVMKEK